MSGYIEKFVVPASLGSEITLTGATISVSAKFLKQADPLDVVLDVPIDGEDPSEMIDGEGVLFVEARDPDDANAERIGHCIFILAEGNPTLKEIDVQYPYRGNEIATALVALAERLTGINMPMVPSRYL